MFLQQASYTPSFGGLGFRGAGVNRSTLSDLESRFAMDHESISKFEIARTMLSRLNEEGDRALQQRREVVKRVCEFEDFSTGWPDDQLKAQGLVAQVQKVVNVKDSFTRMRQERDAEVRKHRKAQLKKDEEIRQRRQLIAEIRSDFYRLFGMDNAQERGLLLEEVLNRLFDAGGILVRESFRRSSEKGRGTIEQVDGVIELALGPPPTSTSGFRVDCLPSMLSTIICSKRRALSLGVTQAFLPRFMIDWQT